MNYRVEVGKSVDVMPNCLDGGSNKLLKACFTSKIAEMDTMYASVVQYLPKD